MSEWFKTWFEHPASVERYAHRSDSESSLAVRSLCNALVDKGLTLGDFALDAGCGRGRHLESLSRIFSMVIGIDLSFLVLKEASAYVNESVSVIQSDLRKLPIESNKINFIGSFFSSYGYFHNDDINQEILSSFSRLLSKNGLLLIDLMNPTLHEVPLDVETHTSTENYEYTEIRTYDSRKKVLQKHGIAKNKHGNSPLDTEYIESLRVYTQSEIEHSARAFEMELLDVFGDYNGTVYNESSDRMIVTFRKL